MRAPVQTRTAERRSVGGIDRSHRRGWIHTNEPAGAGATGLVAIVIAVLAISALAPDLVAGPEEEHTPIAAMITWVWGVIAAGAFVITLLASRDRPGRSGAVRLLAADVATVWTVAAAVGVFGPVMTTDGDPSVPICALLAPIVATALTLTACRLLLVLDGEGGPC
jgi:hypothetical protein